LGTYDPTVEPTAFKVDADKVKQWMANGAQPTETVRVLLKKNGVIE
ncbi:MAG: 30S ribosomal protein S16, partial [Oscillospiraceae bacterium]|nr:30S ribosomal protein S16 [Oscillospiraceae bacterium]